MDSDTARPGRRGRHTRCNRESSRSAGGLRLFSLKVVEKIRARVRTTYNAVANELVSDQNMSGGSARDGKSIRRRCYDAINVLLACGLIKKDDKKQIVWRGHGTVEVDRLRAEVEKKTLEVEQKKKLLQDMELKHKTLNALLALGASREAESQDCGSGSGGSSSACSRSSQSGQRYTIPFMLVQAPAGAQVQVHTSDDRTQIQFELTDAPPELHDDCSVVMRLQQHQAERQANQRCRKSQGADVVQATDSGQPTPAPQAVGPLACDFSSTPETLGQLPPQSGTAQPQPPQPCIAQHLARQLQPQHAQRLQGAGPNPQALEFEGPQPQINLPPPQQLQHQTQEDQMLTCQQVQAGAVLPTGQTGVPPPEQQHPSDFLAHLKPVVTNRSKMWHHHHQNRAPGALPQPQPQAMPPMTVHARPPGPTWHPVAGLPALSTVPQGQSQPQAVFTPSGGLPPFLCARSLEEQLQPQQVCPPVGASVCFHQQLTSNALSAEGDLGCLGQDAHQLHLPLHHQQPLQQPLQHPPQPPMPLHQQQPQQQQQPVQVFEQMPGAPTSLYTFEQMADEHVPAHLLPFGADDPDPLGLGTGAASLAADQLGYMGWPFTTSPDPFSPSAFLVTPSFMKGQCREPTLQMGAVHVGVQQ